MSVKLGINGFGRIGKLSFQAALAKEGVEVVAVKMIHLLQQTTWHI